MNYQETEEFERAVDREVQRRLATDRAYRFAENAEEQAERETEIEDAVVRELEWVRKYGRLGSGRAWEVNASDSQRGGTR